MYMRGLGPPVLHYGLSGSSLFLLRVVAQGVLRCGGRIRNRFPIRTHEPSLGDEGGEDSTRDEVSLASSSSSWPLLNITQYLDGWYEG